MKKKSGNLERRLKGKPVKERILLLLLCVICICGSSISSLAAGEESTPAATESAQTTTEATETEVEETEPESTEEEKQFDINSLDLPGIEKQVYAGTSCTPTVKIDGLQENTDYSVAYRNNNQPGTAFAVLTGMGKYCGTAEIPFEIVLSAVKNPKSGIVSDGILIEWDMVSGADGYYIFRKENSGSYSKAATITGAVQYTDKAVISGREYRYQIQAFTNHSVVGEKSAETYTRYLSKPSLKAAYSGDRIELTWEKCEGAEGYYIYRKVEGKDYTKIAEVQNVLKWSDTQISDGKYTYKIRAYAGKSESVNSDPAAVTPAMPKLISVSSESYNSLKVKWQNVAGEDGYYIYRQISENSWQKIAQVNANVCTWTDKNLTCGKEYIYTVKAFVKGLESPCDKNGIKGKPVPSAPELSKTVANASSVTVNWQSVAGATKYYVYRKTGSGGWKKLASVTSTSYQDKIAKYGVKYTYTVKSIRNSIAGKYDTKGLQGAVQLNYVTLKSVYVGSDGKGTVSWDSISHADGYLIYRKSGNGSWKQVGSVSSCNISWSEKSLSKSGQYSYTVSGYMLLNNKKTAGKRSSGISPKLEYTGEYVRNVKKTYLGTTGAGRKMYSYTIGTGKNHMVITMAIHGWEDVWSKDGATLVKTGNKLIRKVAGDIATLKKYNYSVIIVPMANPDGIYGGSTCNGPGRCTVYRYNNSGKLVKGGVDLNRCFPAGFSPRYNSRNYTGSKPLMAKEAVVLKKYVDSSKGSGKNIYIDAHGWLNETITKNGNTGKIYSAFKKYFPNTRRTSFGRGLGYISGYAQSVGYEAALFEFPYVSSESSFNRNNYGGKFISSIYQIMKTIH